MLEFYNHVSIYSSLSIDYASNIYHQQAPSYRETEEVDPTCKD